MAALSLLRSGCRGKSFLVKRTSRSVRWHIWALLFILLSPSWVTVAGTGGRAMTTDVSVQRYDWFSNETVIIDFSLRDAPYQQSLTASWSLFDEDGVKRNRTSDGVDSFGALNEFHQEALLTEASKPLAPPPMDTFSAPVPSEHEIPEPIEHAPYPYLPPPKV